MGAQHALQESNGGAGSFGKPFQKIAHWSTGFIFLRGAATVFFAEGDVELPDVWESNLASPKAARSLCPTREVLILSCAAVSSAGSSRPLCEA